MTEEELFDKKTFINLFNMSRVDRIEREDYLFLQARKFGLEKRFKDTIKRYEEILSDTLPMKGTLDLPKCKYDISNYEMGNYTCKVNGIKNKDDIKFSNIPVLPVERYINEETGKEKVKIVFYKENEWKEMTVDKSQLAINQKLLLLSDNGLDVNSENVKFYIRYFSDIFSMNDIKKLESVSHIGWRRNDFIPYDSHGIFDGADEFRSAYSALSSKGDYNKWKECVTELRKNKTMKILMAVTFASPLLEKLGIQPYIANLWSSLSGNGKTLSCMVAMSIWGNPCEGALRLSTNSTQNYYVAFASFMRNITCYFDELQIVKKNKYFDLEGLVMDLCNGTEKGRLTKSSQAKEIKVWFNNFLFTNNDKLVKENQGEQVYNRVIDIEISEKIIDNGQETARTIRNNYGFAGKEYIKYIKSVGFENISKRFAEINNDIIEKTKSTDKQSSSLASLILADELACKSIFVGEEPLNVEDIVPLVNDKTEIRTSSKSKEYIIDIISANKKRFEEGNNGECWGRKDNYICTINHQILLRELQKGGFEFNSVKKEWADAGFLIKNSANKYVHQTTMNGERGNFVILELTK